MRLFLLISAMLLPALIFAQEKVTKIELLGADELVYDENLGLNAKKLIGDVRFKHEGAIMNCDSAYLYSESNNLDAFGRVYINQGDTLHLYSDKLKYYGNTRKAEMINNVKLVDNDMTLTSKNLIYDLKKDIGYYTRGGRMISKKNDTLTSKIGYYYSTDKAFFFRDDVVLINPEYTINSDTLKFNTSTEIAYFFGPTTIVSKENTIYCENGWYDTQKDVSQFSRNAYLITKEQKLQGDSLYYDRKAGIGKAFKNVLITDTVNKFLINGEYAIHFENEETSTITGTPMLTMIFDKDSLFLHADTLYAEMDSTREHRIIHAYHHSKFYKEDMQGVCDSLVYTMGDSTIRLFTEPILWSKENQMTAEFISIKTADGKVDSMMLQNSGFIISQEDTLWFNQVKGKNIFIYFLDNELNTIFVKENGETIYFAKEDDGTIFGLNNAVSEDLVITMKEGQIDKINFLKNVDGTLFPIEEVSDGDLKLKNFTWLDQLRPRSKEDIFIRKELMLPAVEAKDKPKKKKRK